MSQSNHSADVDVREELARLKDELAEANKIIATAEDVGVKILADLVPSFMHASALTEICEKMYQLLLGADVHVQEGWLRAFRKTHELYELGALRSVVGMVDLLRQRVTEGEKLSDAEMLQKAITAFSTPYGDADQITAHMAAKIQELVGIVETAARSKQAKAGAAGRISKHPVSVAKPAVFTFWKEWRSGKHPRLRTNEQFAMESIRRWPELTNIKVITGWCTNWNKEEKNHYAG